MARSLVDGLLIEPGHAAVSQSEVDGILAGREVEAYQQQQAAQAKYAEQVQMLALREAMRAQRDGGGGMGGGYSLTGGVEKGGSSPFDVGAMNPDKRGEIMRQVLGTGDVKVAKQLKDAWELHDEFNGASTVATYEQFLDEKGRKDKIPSDVMQKRFNDPLWQKKYRNDYLDYIESDPQWAADKKGGAAAKLKAVTAAKDRLRSEYGPDAIDITEEQQAQIDGLDNGFLADFGNRTAGSIRQAPAQIVAAAANLGPWEGVTPEDVGLGYKGGALQSSRVSEGQREADAETALAMQEGRYGDAAGSMLTSGLAGTLGTTAGLLVGGGGVGAGARALAIGGARLAGVKAAARGAAAAEGAATGGKVAQYGKGFVRALDPRTATGSALAGMNLAELGGNIQSDYDTLMSLPEAEFAARFPDYIALAQQLGPEAARDQIAGASVTDQARLVGSAIANQALLAMGGIERGALAAAGRLRAGGIAGLRGEATLSRTGAIAGGAAKGAGFEGVQEFAQTGLQDLNSQVGTREFGGDVNLERAAQRAAAGGIVGTALGGSIGGAGGAIRPVVAKAAPASEAAPVIEPPPVQPNTGVSLTVESALSAIRSGAMSANDAWQQAAGGVPQPRWNDVYRAFMDAESESSKAEPAAEQERFRTARDARLAREAARAKAREPRKAIGGESNIVDGEFTVIEPPPRLAIEGPKAAPDPTQEANKADMDAMRADAQADLDAVNGKSSKLSAPERVRLREELVTALAPNGEKMLRAYAEKKAKAKAKEDAAAAVEQAKSSAQAERQSVAARRQAEREAKKAADDAAKAAATGAKKKDAPEVREAQPAPQETGVAPSATSNAASPRTKPDNGSAGVAATSPVPEQGSAQPAGGTAGADEQRAAAGDGAREPADSLKVLQNRDRSTPASIEQMNSIAGKPDGKRLGFSRDFASGAPAVERGAAASLGKADTMTSAEGREIPVQYAVIEADDLLASNNVTGAANKDYSRGAKGKSRAVAGNGRVAGLQAAYQRGTTDAYVNQIVADEALHGVPASAVRAMKKPVLVRLMNDEDITDNIGDESNQSGTAALSPIEQAKNDMRRIDVAGLEFTDGGNFTVGSLRAFIQSMPQSERAGLLDGGQPNSKAEDRLLSAAFAQAYESDELIRLQSSSRDEEAATVMKGLAIAAGGMAKLKGAGDLDIRSLVAEAAEISISARRAGRNLKEEAMQGDMTRSPQVAPILEAMIENIRSAKKIGELLQRYATDAYNESQKSGEPNMFGEVEPRRSKDELLGVRRESRSNQEVGQPAGAKPATQDAARGAENAGGTSPAFELSQQTNASTAAEEARLKRIKAEEAAADAAAANKKKADSDVDNFQLGGAQADGSLAPDLFDGPLRYRRRGTPAPITAIALDRLKQIAASYGAPLTVHDAVADARKATGNDTIPDDAQGFYDKVTKRAHLIRANINGDREAAIVVDHELVGHKGLESLFSPNGWQMFKDEVLTNPTIKARRDAFVAQGMSADEAIEEALASYAEGKPDYKPDIWQKILDAVRSFARRIGLVRRYSDAELASVFGAARKAMLEGAPVDATVIPGDTPGTWKVITRDNEVFTRTSRPDRVLSKLDGEEGIATDIRRRFQDIRATMRKVSAEVMPSFRPMLDSDTDADRVRDQLRERIGALLASDAVVDKKLVRRISAKLEERIGNATYGSVDLEQVRDLASAIDEVQFKTYGIPMIERMNVIKRTVISKLGLKGKDAEQDALNAISTYLAAKHAGERNAAFSHKFDELTAEGEALRAESVKKFEKGIAKLKKDGQWTKDVAGNLDGDALALARAHAAEIEAIHSAHYEGEPQTYGQMPTGQALETIKQFEANQTPETLAAIEAWRADMNGQNQALGYETGRWGDKAAIAKAVYGFKSYVPMKGWDMETSPDKTMFGEFSSGLARAPKKAEGRDSFAANVVAQMTSDLRRALSAQQEQNIAFAAIAQSAMKPDAVVSRVSTSSVGSPELSSENAVWFFNGDDTVTSVQYGMSQSKIEAKGQALDYATKVANGIKNVRKPDSETTKKFGKLTRLFGRTKTFFNPDFWLAGTLRDYGQFLSAALLENKDFTMEKAGIFSKNVATGLASGRTWKLTALLHANDIKGIKALAENDPWFASALDFVQRGGLTSLSQIYGMEFNLESFNENLNSNPARAWNAVNGFFEKLNGSLELSHRVAMYRTLTENMGWDGDKAAAYVKNMTNYEVSGEAGGFFGAIYAFFRPAATGAQRLMQAMGKDPALAAQMAGVMAAAGFGLFMLSAMMAEEDDGSNAVLEDDAKSWTRALRFKLPGSETMVNIPLPYGFGFAVAMGAQVGFVAMGADGDIDRRLKKFGSSMINITTDSFSPIQPSKADIFEDSWMWASDTFAPSIARGFLGMAANKNSFGDRIFTDWGFGKLPSDAYYGPTRLADSGYERLATTLFDLTGGAIDVSPGTLDYLTSMYVTPLDALQDIVFATSLEKAARTAVGGLAGTAQDLDWARYQRISGELTALHKTREIFAETGMDENLAAHDEAHPGAEEAYERFREYEKEVQGSITRSKGLRLSKDRSGRREARENEGEFRRATKRDAYLDPLLKPYAD